MKFWLLLFFALATSKFHFNLYSQELPVLHQTFGIENGLYNTIINDVLPAKGNERYFASEGSGLIHFHKGNFRYYGIPEGLRIPFISSIAEYNEDTLLVASVNEVYLFYKSSKMFELFSQIPSSQTIRKICVHNKKIYIHSSNEKILIINQQSGVNTAVYLPIDSVKQVVLSPEYVYALSNDSLIYRIGDDTIEKFFSNGEKIFRIGFLRGYLVVIQNNKIIRLGRHIQNIIHLNLPITNVRNLTSNKEYIIARVSDDQIIAINVNAKIEYLNIPVSSNRFFILDNGELWVSFSTSLKCYLFPSVSKYVSYSFNENTKIYDTYQTSENLIFSLGREIYVLNKSNRLINKLLSENETGLILQIKSIYKDTIIFNTETGLYYLLGNTLKPFFDKGKQVYSGRIDVLPSGIVSIPFKDKLILKKGIFITEYAFGHHILWHHWVDSSMLFVQSESKLHVYQVKNHEIKELKTFNIDDNALPYVDDTSNTIWVFSDGFITCYDIEKETSKIQVNFNIENIFKTYHIGKDSLILMSDQLYFIYLKNNQISKHKIKYSEWILKRFKVLDFFTHQSNLYLITNEGILKIHKNILFRDINPDISISNALVNGVQKKLHDSSKLRSSENTIQLFFTVSSDIFSEIEFRYRYAILSGKRKADTVDSSIPELYLSNLNPDTYSIRYELLSSDNEILDYGYLNFTISRPLWQNAWFIVIVLSGLIGISMYIIRWRTNQIREKVKLKEMLLETETKALRLQMNPHFLYNSLESIEGFILKSDKISAIKHLNNFTRLMRMILEGSDKGLHSLKREKDLLKYYLELENMRSGNQFDYSIEVQPEGVDEEHLLIPSMLIQPHVENSIIHGVRPLKERRGRIEVSFRVYEEEQKIEVFVEDNGVGRAKSYELSVKNDIKSKSLALQINSQRLKMMSQTYKNLFFVSIEDLFDAYGLPSGTRVKIQMPIIN